MFQANPTTGALLPRETVFAGTGTQELAVDPDGVWVFALNRLSGDVARYLVDRLPRALPDLLAILDRLDQASLAAKRPLTLPFVRAQLGARD